ncbi:hypothetical protein EP331_01070 [bacterium]|nr:MAG: hypothetical protein EP331_01070 [bacterium]
MKQVQNLGYWRELLDHVPQFLLVFKIDEDEKAELVFANQLWEKVSGYKADEFLLRSLNDVNMKKALDEIIDKVALHSRGELKNEECTFIWTAKDGTKTTFNFIYDAFRTSTSSNFHVSVLCSTEVISNPIIANTVKTGETFIAESMVMKTLLQRIPGIVQSQSAILIQGEKAVGKSTLVKHILDQKEMLAWPNHIEFNSSTVTESSNWMNASCLVIENIHELSRKSQEILLKLISEAEINALDLKILATTSGGIDKLLDSGEFLPELYYKLGAHTLHLPPLRFRKEDVQTYLNERLVSLRFLIGNPNLAFSDECNAFIRTNEWEQNFLSLSEFVHDAISYIDGDSIELPDEYRKEDGDQSNLFSENLSGIISFDAMTKNYLKEVLKKTGGKIYGRDGAAHLLKLKPTTLQSKLKKLGVK